MIVPDWSGTIPVVNGDADSGDALSNPFTDGQLFTITGSGFGVKPQAAPLKFSKFNDMPNGTLLEANDPDWIHYSGAGATEGALVSDVNTRYDGSKSAYNDMSRNGFDTNYIVFPATDEVFLSYWYATNDAVYGSGGTSWVGKLARITSTPASGGEGPYNGRGNHLLSHHDPSGLSPALIYNSEGLGNNVTLAYQNVASNNDWVRIDMAVKLSDIDTNNGLLFSKSWGKQEESHTITNRTTTGGDYQLDSVILGVMTANETSPTNAGMKNADVYIDNTRMRVELCDSATYPPTNPPEIQPAVSWADDQVVITANKGRFTSGTYYLHVLNDLGVSVGYQEVTI